MCWMGVGILRHFRRRPGHRPTMHRLALLFLDTSLREKSNLAKAQSHYCYRRSNIVAFHLDELEHIYPNFC